MRADPKRGRIVFLAANASFSHSNLAGWYLQSYTAGMGWKWVNYETLAQEDPHEVLNRLNELNPDILLAGFYVFNHAFLVTVLEMYARLSPNCIIIAGGPEFLGNNRDFLTRHPFIRAVVRGEGEIPLKAILGKHGNPREWPGIKGVCMIVDSQYSDGGTAEVVEELDSIPSPFSAHIGVPGDAESIFPSGGASPPGRTPTASMPSISSSGGASPPGRTASFDKPFIQIETSRGCRNSCAFCTSGNSAPVRYFSLERIRCDLATIAKAGITHVRVVDRTFNENRNRSIPLLEMFRDEFPAISFHLEVDPAAIDESFAAGLAGAQPGKFHMDVGVQTLDQAVLDNTGRRCRADRTIAGLRTLCQIRSVEVHADLIACLPGATLQGLYSDLSDLVEIGPAELQLEVLKLLPGTAISAGRAKWDMVASPEPPYDILRTASMPPGDVHAARWLSRLVDWFYATPALRPTVVMANKLVPGFWGALCAFCMERHRLRAAPSIVNRFRMLFDFLEGRDERLRNSLKYAWMAEGFSPSDPVCEAGQWKDPLPADAVLVEGDAKARFSRIAHLAIDRDYFFAYGYGKNRRAVAVFAR